MNRVNRVQFINRARIFKIINISVIPKTTAIVPAVQAHQINLLKINLQSILLIYDLNTTNKL